MPFELPDQQYCLSCPHDKCVSYIREQSKKMKDRNTLYRIKQNAGLACAFDEWLPGFSASAPIDLPLLAYSEKIISNAKVAGSILESQVPNWFGDVEAPFIITAGQSGKVRGDTFEMICRAIFWNCAALSRQAPAIPKNSSFAVPASLQLLNEHREIAILTLGDNYDLKKLLRKEFAEQLSDFEKKLETQSTSISYSTPDVVCIDISSQPDEIKSHFNTLIADLSPSNQATLSSARLKLEGRVDPKDVRFAAGIKTSIRSDRMYQFLYEANSWKFIWARAFKTNPSPYYVLTSQTFGANPKKLASVDFSSLELGANKARRAIDGVFTVRSPKDLIDWLAEVIEDS